MTDQNVCIVFGGASVGRAVRPWAGKSLEHQLVQASSFTNQNKDISKVTQAGRLKPQSHTFPTSKALWLRVSSFPLGTFKIIDV